MIEQQKNAALTVSLMDLTSLNNADDSATIQALVNSIKPKLGTPAALCVYSQFVAEAKIALAARGLAQVKVATVTNFPSGDAPLDEVVSETLLAVERGADEIDLVLPYKALLAGDANTVRNYIRESKRACGSQAQLKVIIESGELKTAALITEATMLAIENGADFVKTSTGKVAVNATLEAAQYMLKAIKNSHKLVGFKAAGGVKTVKDAAAYLQLAGNIMGADYVTATHFRFGASGLLTDVYKVLNETPQ